MAVFESPETVDMMICLKEILEVTLVPPESVVKVRTHVCECVFMCVNIG